MMQLGRQLRWLWNIVHLAAHAVAIVDMSLARLDQKSFKIILAIHFLAGISRIKAP
jgi:hypothetical protein